MAEETKPTKTLSELKVEIKFHLGQMAGHAVKIGSLLIEAKEQVEHGEWGKWLEENFNLKKSSAANFMNISERFGANFQTFGNLGYSQMLNLLALPEGEEEKFIAEKAAEGTPVEDMTVKNLREEIKNYKTKLEEVTQERDGYKRANEISDQQLENLGDEVEKLRQGREDDGRRLGEMAEENLNLREDKEELQEKVDDLQNELLRKETTTVEVAPADYETTQAELTETKATVEKLQGQLKDLQEKPVEVAVEYPADYEAMKAELAELKDKQANLQQEFKARQKLTKIFESLPFLLATETNLRQIIKEMADKEPYVRDWIVDLGTLHTRLRRAFEGES